MKSHIRGDREVVAALRNLGSGIQTRDIDAAAVRAMTPMTDRTKAALKANRNFVGKYSDFFPQPSSPRKGGHVDQGIVVRRDRQSSKTRRAYRLGAVRRARFLLHLVEFGTAPHFQPNFHGGFMHPGARPSPALIPAYDAEKAGVVRTLGFEIIEIIERRARSLGMRVSRGRRR